MPTCVLAPDFFLIALYYTFNSSTVTLRCIYSVFCKFFCAAQVPKTNISYSHVVYFLQPALFQWDLRFKRQHLFGAKYCSNYNRSEFQTLILLFWVHLSGIPCNDLINLGCMNIVYRYVMGGELVHPHLPLEFKSVLKWLIITLINLEHVKPFFIPKFHSVYSQYINI